ncbi:MAG: glycogen debranching N-terminal domain-containing protein, partial [Flavipsychrobacter sp.]
MDDLVLLNDKYYISVSSTYADDKTKVLNHEDTFGIFDRWGNVKQLGEEVQGIYHNGMRYISELELLINGTRPLLLSSSVKEENEILSVDLTNPNIEKGNLLKDLIHIGRSKFIRNGACMEQIRLSNFDYNKHEFEISLELNADFRDIFEIRGIKREKRGEVYEIKHLPDNSFRICYLGLDGKRRITEILFSEQPTTWENHNKAIFKIALAAHEQKNFDYTINFLTDEEQKTHIGYIAGRAALEKEIKESGKILASVTTDNKQFNQWLQRSRFDLLSLLSNTKYGKYP